MLGFLREFREAKLEAATKREKEVVFEHSTSSGKTTDFELARKKKRTIEINRLARLWLPSRSAFTTIGTKVSLEEAQELGIIPGCEGAFVSGDFVLSSAAEQFFLLLGNYGARCSIKRT